VAAADVNNDGKARRDRLELQPQHQRVPGNGNGTFGPAIGIDTGEYPRSVMVTDVNGDGKMDLVATGVGINVGGAQFAAEGAEAGLGGRVIGQWQRNVPEPRSIPAVRVPRLDGGRRLQRATARPISRSPGCSMATRST